MISLALKKMNAELEPFTPTHSPYILHECMCAGLGYMRMMIENTSKALQVGLAINKELQKNYGHLFSDEVKISEKAGVCQTPDDLLCLQQKTAQKWLDNCAKESHKLYQLIAKNYMPVSLHKACMIME